jgi:hypothetical protein
MHVSLLCLYVVLSCAGRGLCDGLITRPEESYRVSKCMWLRNLKREAKAKLKVLWSQKKRGRKLQETGENNLMRSFIICSLVSKHFLLCFHYSVTIFHLRNSLTTHLWMRRGERRCSSCSFTITALGGGEWSALRSGSAVPPGKEPPVPFVQDAGWTQN